MKSRSSTRNWAEVLRSLSEGPKMRWPLVSSSWAVFYMELFVTLKGSSESSLLAGLNYAKMDNLAIRFVSTHLLNSWFF